MVDLKIFLNEIQTEIEENCTAYKLRNKVDKNCDVVILNGFPLKEDKVLKEYDRLTLIERGKTPTKDELERVSNEIIKQMNHLHKLNYSINTLKTSTVAKENTSIHNRYNIFFIMIYPPFILSNKIIMRGWK